MPSSKPPDRRLLQLDPADNVCAATTTLVVGDEILFEGMRLRVLDDVAVGHKIAIQTIPVGSKILKYGAIIGSASRDIQPGEKVHTHNLRSDYLPTFARGEHERRGNEPPRAIPMRESS